MNTPISAGTLADQLLDVEMRIAKRADELSKLGGWDRRDSSAPWHQAELEILGWSRSAESRPIRKPAAVS
jgi:hypothetical protein